eukprot:352434-Chlamydomonas_euryale.AAC.5
MLRSKRLGMPQDYPVAGFQTAYKPATYARLGCVHGRRTVHCPAFCKARSPTSSQAKANETGGTGLDPLPRRAADVALAVDPPTGYVNLLNTGVFAMRSNVVTRRLMATWLGMRGVGDGGGVSSSSSAGWRGNQAPLNSRAFVDYVPCEVYETCATARQAGLPAVFRHPPQFGSQRGPCPMETLGDVPCHKDTLGRNFSAPGSAPAEDLPIAGRGECFPGQAAET